MKDSGGKMPHLAPSAVIQWDKRQAEESNIYEKFLKALFDSDYKDESNSP